MRVLVTGAAGFVGANLAFYLARDEHEVHVTCRPNSDRWRLSGIPETVLHEVDLAVRNSADALVGEVAPEWIFHLAAHGAYSWQVDPQKICEANLTSTINLADAAERYGVQAFVHAGSSSEYGFKDHPAREDERPDPNSTYAVTKTAATMYCRHRAREGELPAVTLRLYSVYGGMEDPRRLIHVLLTEGLERRLPPLVSPDTARDFVYIEDVCEAFVLAAEKAVGVAGSIYNVGSGKQTTLRELVQYVCELFEMSDAPCWGTHAQRKWDSRFWCADVTQIGCDLGWSAETDIKRGLRQTLTSMSDGPLAAHNRSDTEAA